ncbi:hypothetical protein [Fontibacillus panacisegetis]|nr:hypothetical protein [Fontibacillus panacisegetis]
MNNIDLSKMVFNRENLIGLLAILDKNENVFTHVEFAEWCGSYWSEWRREQELYESTDKQTINVVDSIYYYFLKYKIDRFEKVKIKEWIQMLSGN